MNGHVTTRTGIEIRIGDVPLPVKLDAIGATLAAVREAHGDTIPPRCWAAMHRAQEAIVDAMLAVNDHRPIELPDVKKRLHHGR
ncbi:MAG: hypothetical protein WC205_16720 [Opitutaceae bacterium]|jgi:phage tail protein X